MPVPPGPGGCPHTAHIISFLRPALMFPHLQTRRPRHTWAEALGKMSNQESNSYLLILGFERDVIELAFSEAPFGSSLGEVRG